MSRSKLRLLLWRWHRRLGLFGVLFIVFLSVSGILLNHSKEFGLTESPVTSEFILSLYGIHAPSVISFPLSNHWLHQIGNNYLHFDESELAYCAGSLTGAVMHQGMVVAACNDEIILFTLAGEVIERIGRQFGLPHPVSGIGRCADKVCIKLPDEQVFEIDVDQLSWMETAREVAWSTPGQPPIHMIEMLKKHYTGQDIVWERVLLDMHSGRFLGQWGVYLTDIIGLILIVLAMSGGYVWFSGRFRK